MINYQPLYLEEPRQNRGGRPAFCSTLLDIVNNAHGRRSKKTVSKKAKITPYKASKLESDVKEGKSASPG